MSKPHYEHRRSLFQCIAQLCLLVTCSMFPWGEELFSCSCLPVRTCRPINCCSWYKKYDPTVIDLWEGTAIVGDVDQGAYLYRFSASHLGSMLIGCLISWHYFSFRYLPQAHFAHRYQDALHDLPATTPSNLVSAALSHLIPSVREHRHRSIRN